MSAERRPRKNAQSPEAESPDAASRHARVGSIFRRARKLSGEALERLLAKEAAADPSLRREVERLLAHAGGKGLVRSVRAEIRNVAADLVDRDAPPRRIGVYEIGEEIGRGGMSVVYRARDTRLQRDVAMKTLLAGPSIHPDRLAALEREARILAALNHPNVATIHGLEIVDGKAFVILELVAGETLAARLARASLPVAEAVDVCTQVGRAVAAAHALGVIHGDLKPGNIMLTRDGVVKVLDFGISRAPQAPGHGGRPAAATANRRARDGRSAGTPGYVSPEKARGGAIDERADVWAWGRVLFECLAGKPIVEEGLARHEEPVLELELLPADVPRPMRELIAACVERDVSRRVASMAEACRLLEGAGIRRRRGD